MPRTLCNYPPLSSDSEAIETNVELLEEYSSKASEQEDISDDDEPEDACTNEPFPGYY